MDMDIDVNVGGDSDLSAPDFVSDNQAEREAAESETILPTPSQLNPDMDFSSSIEP